MIIKHSPFSLFIPSSLGSQSFKIIMCGLLATSLGLIFVNNLIADNYIFSLITELDFSKTAFASTIEKNSQTGSTPPTSRQINSHQSNALTDNFELLQVGRITIRIPTTEEFADPSLVKAIIEVESAGDPSARSTKGANGLMQLMPATARLIGVDHNDPQQNVEGGSRYLQQQVKRFGDIKLAVAAYNMGPTALSKAMKQSKAKTWEELLAADHNSKISLPTETKIYVKKVWSVLQA